MMRDESFSSSTDREGTPVYLNVYSFCHCCNLVCGRLGIGLYHTAIQAFGIQFMFHGWAGIKTGVSEVLPRTCPYKFEQQILLGNLSYSFGQFDTNIIEPLKQKYISNKYDLLNNNCNHFALQFAEKLGFGNNHPRSYIFRLTNFFNIFRCCLPSCVLSGRLDWFTTKQKQQEQLNQIRNSEIKHNDSNQSKYQQLIQQQEEVLQLHQSNSRYIVNTRKPHQRPKIFQIRTNAP